MNAADNEPMAYRPELDGIRGLAIIGVLCSHGVSLIGLFEGPNLSFLDKFVMYSMSPLWGGVDLFFALSGFLISGILLTTKSKQHYFSSFYARRVLRIFPIYYLVLVASLVTSHYLPAISSQLPPTESWKVAYFLYLQNWPVFWHGAKIMSGFWGIYWSLAVEEQFYLIWPLLVFLLSPVNLIRVCIVGFVCALPLRIFMSAYVFGGNFGLAQITTSRVDGLLLGSACAIYMYQHHRPVPLRWIVWALCGGASIMGYIVVFHHAELVSPSRWILTFGISGFALLSGSVVALSQHHAPPIQRFLTYPLLRQFGKYSYGIYVYHLFIFLPLRNFISQHRTFFTEFTLPERLVVIALSAGIAFGLAKFSYDVFESRLLRLKRYFHTT
jgi:peptidoglycan/LPS O-acetylase OafA/YrhL